MWQHIMQTRRSGESEDVRHLAVRPQLKFQELVTKLSFVTDVVAHVEVFGGHVCDRC